MILSMGTKYSMVLWTIFVIFYVSSGVNCVPRKSEKNQYDTFSDDWKNLPTHMEFRDWLLNQFKDQGLPQLTDEKTRNRKPLIHIIIIGDLGDSSSSSSEYSNSDSYSDESYSYSESDSESDSSSDESSGDSEDSSLESTETPDVDNSTFIQISLDGQTSGRSDLRKPDKTNHSVESTESEEDDKDSSNDQSASIEDSNDFEEYIPVGDDIAKSTDIPEEEVKDITFKDESLNMILAEKKR